MELFPAIDIRFGRAVRLARRDAEQGLPYDEDPAALAERFAMQGARQLHLTDLDRAFGDGDNSGVIGRIITRIGSHVRIQLSGGLRTVQRLRDVQELEVARFVLVGPVLADPDLLPQAVELLGSSRIAVGIEARNGLAVLHGWQQSTTIFARDIAVAVARAGVKTIIYTDISKEGMLQGPDLVGAVELQELSGAGVIVSGGVSTIDDLIRIKASALAGVVIGRALYEGRFTLSQALTALLDA